MAMTEAEKKAQAAKRAAAKRRAQAAANKNSGLFGGASRGLSRNRMNQVDKMQ